MLLLFSLWLISAGFQKVLDDKESQQISTAADTRVLKCQKTKPYKAL